MAYGQTARSNTILGRCRAKKVCDTLPTHYRDRAEVKCGIVPDQFRYGVRHTSGALSDVLKLGLYCGASRSAVAAVMGCTDGRTSRGGLETEMKDGLLSTL